MALLDLFDGGQFWARACAVDASAAISLVGAVARVCFQIPRFHSRKVFLARSREIDLERASERLLVAQKLEKLGKVLCSSSYQIHGLATGGADLDILAAVEEAVAVFVGHQLVQLGHEKLVALWSCLSNVDKERLIRRTGECAEQIEEVFLAGRAGRDDGFGALEVRLESVDLMLISFYHLHMFVTMSYLSLGTADIAILPLFATDAHQFRPLRRTRCLCKSIIRTGQL